MLFYIDIFRHWVYNIVIKYRSKEVRIMTTLIIFMFVFLIIIVVGILNEKFIHIPNDIALVIFSTALKNLIKSS